MPVNNVVRTRLYFDHGKGSGPGYCWLWKGTAGNGFNVILRGSILSLDFLRCGGYHKSSVPGHKIDTFFCRAGSRFMEEQLPDEFRYGKRLEVESYFENTPLEEFLQAYLPIEGRRYLKKLVDRGLVEVNGITRSLDFRLQPGDIVEIGQPEKEPEEQAYPEPEVVWHNENMAAVQKYPGQKIGTRPEGTSPGNQKLPESFLETFPLSVHHRAYPLIPVGTYSSGMVLLFNSEETQSKFQEKMDTEQVRVTIRAIIDGRLQNDRTVDRPVGPSPHDASLKVVREEGKEARTKVKVEQEFRKFSCVRVIPKTAVNHQVRVHLSHIHHPLSVDPQYGYREELKLSEFKQDYKEKPFQREKPLISRTSMHFEEVTFPDPETGESKTLEASLPEDMQITLKQLDRHDTGR